MKNKEPKPPIHLLPLGRMGWMPADGCHTCCYCLEYGHRLILLDAGTGLANLSDERLQRPIDDYSEIIIFLSHYHLDHLAGLFYLSRFFYNKEVIIAGPGPGIYGKSVSDTLSNIITSPFCARPLDRYPMNFHFVDLEHGTHDIGGLRVETRIQTHSEPSLGIKLDNRICYCTDTACDDGTGAFVKDCDLLLHEVWMDNDEYLELTAKAPDSPSAAKTLKSHSNVKKVAQTARNANIEKLIMIHLNPAYSQERLKSMEKEAQNIHPNTILPQEGKTVLVGNE